MRNYLTFGGVSTSSYGCYISGGGTFNSPTREYEMIDIPGRNGALIGLEKRMGNIDVTYPAFIVSSFKTNLENLRSALIAKTGYQELTDTYHTDEYRLACFPGDIDVDVDHLRAGQFDLVFNCKPQRFLTSGKTKTTITSASGSITNPTLFDSKPLITVTGYGELWIGSQKITIDNVYPSVTIDSEMGDCYYQSNNANAQVTFQQNDFPVLVPGANATTKANTITTIEITPRWWRV